MRSSASCTFWAKAILCGDSPIAPCTVRCFESWPHQSFFEAIRAKHHQLLETQPKIQSDDQQASEQIDDWNAQAPREMRDFVAALDLEHFGIIARESSLSIRLMRDDDADYAQMSAWLTDPRVLEFYEGRDSPQSIEDIRLNYSPRVMALENNTPCFIELDSVPIGYIQFYPAEEDAAGVWGLDQFIGIPDQWNRGIGTRAVRLMLDYLFQTVQATKCVLDPHATNHRAIRCYEKAGFRKVRLLRQHERHEGELRDAWLMEATPAS
jgi:aminoglycoside 6'-N-acetyltransferase